ncbi:MAG: tRNA (adenosine(37)-N6)-threonylcarbamoyltransferase complex transferase subunit TsaD, partial [Planctomycetaceae bacterium]|nr:tRNA (adenosine(37)-N6)-threonylcarbamoyltransferase complex transferase subunit TsaD [Planctomycetaceae bacterium]
MGTFAVQGVRPVTLPPSARRDCRQYCPRKPGLRPLAGGSCSPSPAIGAYHSPSGLPGDHRVHPSGTRDARQGAPLRVHSVSFGVPRRVASSPPSRDRGGFPASAANLGRVRWRYPSAVRVLGIESSCDETAAAVVEDGARVLSDVVASQEDLHAPYGGVVPEVAGRAHEANIVPVVGKALRDAGLSLAGLDGIAVTNRPGLVGSLLVGVQAAKSLALATGLPLVGVNHVLAHAHANMLCGTALRFPLVALVVSGGHTSLYLCRSPLEETLLGATVDDAAGEAFDKVAALLGLGFPGGPAVDRLAREG